MYRKPEHAVLRKSDSVQQSLKEKQNKKDKRTGPPKETWLV